MTIKQSFVLLSIAVWAFATAAFDNAPDGELRSIQSKSNQVKSYIVLFEQEPAIAYQGGIAGLPATKPAKDQAPERACQKVSEAP